MKNHVTNCELTIKNFSIGAIVWYEFKPESSILYIYSGQPDEAVRVYLEGKGMVALCNVNHLNEVQLQGVGYDYVVGIDVL